MGLNDTINRLAKQRVADTTSPNTIIDDSPQRELILDRDEYDLMVSAARMLLNSTALKRGNNDTLRITKRKKYLRFKLQSALSKLHETLTDNDSRSACSS